MAKPSLINRVVTQVNKLPESVRSSALTLTITRAVRFSGTADVVIESLTETQSRLHIKYKKKVQNHIGSVHAAAMALVAESATGFLVGVNLTADKVPVIKAMNIDFTKRATGDLTAEAHLTPEQIETMRTQDKGDVTVAVTVTDEKGVEPIECEMIWAWTPLKRK